jgi:aryl-alcohol dehydrogenase-like predicted oxidoreductase
LQKHIICWDSFHSKSGYSLAKRQVELEVIPACRAYGLGFICWSPLAGGMLAGILEKVEKGRRAKLEIDDKTRQHLKRYEALYRDVGESPSCIALARLPNNPVVTAPIVGPRTLEQLESSFRTLEIELSEDILQRLDDVFPGPGGEAPMAFAW